MEWRALNLTSGTKVHLGVRTATDTTPLCGGARAATRRHLHLTRDQPDCALCLTTLEKHRPQFGPADRHHHTGYAAFTEANWRASDTDYSYVVTETRQMDRTVLEARLHIYERDGRQVLRLVPLRTNGEAALAAAVWAAAHRPSRRQRLDWHPQEALQGRQWTAKDTAGRIYTLAQDSQRRVAVRAHRGRTELWRWTYDSVPLAKRACALHTASA